MLFLIFFSLWGLPLWLFGTCTILGPEFYVSAPFKGSFPFLRQVLHSHMLLKTQLKTWGVSSVDFHSSLSVQLSPLWDLAFWTPPLGLSRLHVSLLSTQGYCLVLFGFPSLHCGLENLSGQYAGTVTGLTWLVFPLGSTFSAYLADIQCLNILSSVLVFMVITL